MRTDLDGPSLFQPGQVPPPSILSMPLIPRPRRIVNSQVHAEIGGGLEGIRGRRRGRPEKGDLLLTQGRGRRRGTLLLTQEVAVSPLRDPGRAAVGFDDVAAGR